jgi:hypothetical protein
MTVDHRGLGQQRVPRPRPRSTAMSTAISTSAANVDGRDHAERCSTKRRRPWACITSLKASVGGSCSSSACSTLGFAVILILAAIWLGLWFAETAGAARWAGWRARRSAWAPGDLDVQVREEPGDDEIAMLGRIFNQMTRQLKGQRDALTREHQRPDRAAPRLFDSVLSSVTSGVVGLDADGRGRPSSTARPSGFWTWHGQPRDLRCQPGWPFPSSARCFDRLRAGRPARWRRKKSRSRGGGKLENLLVRMSTRRADETGSLWKATWWPSTT